jgi:hypothetical protein
MSESAATAVSTLAVLHPATANMTIPMNRPITNRNELFEMIPMQISYMGLKTADLI